MSQKQKINVSKNEKGILRLFWTIQQTKELPRQGIILAGFKLNMVDTVAAHSFAVSILSYLLARELRKLYKRLDPLKVLEMAVFHDIGEALTGDVGRYIKWDAKEAWDKVEETAIEKLEREVNFKDNKNESWLQNLVISYNKRLFPYAWIVKVADSLDAAAQTNTEHTLKKTAGKTRNDRKLIYDLENVAKSYEEKGDLEEANFLRHLCNFFKVACKLIREGNIDRIYL